MKHLNLTCVGPVFGPIIGGYVTEAESWSWTQWVIPRPIYMMCTEPIVTFFDIYNAFNFGLLNAFFAAYSWV